MSPVDAEKAAKALQGPTERGRSRADRSQNPKPTPTPTPSVAGDLQGGNQVSEPAVKSPTVESGPQEAPSVASASPSPSVVASDASKTPTVPTPRPIGDPINPARAQLTARTAEQTFLPLVSRISKLNEWIEQAVMAIADAKEVGVTSEHLEDTLRGVARKNDITYTDVPESVRDAIAAQSVAPEIVDTARARLAARTAEQTFLPLVSRISKLREWVQQAVLAVHDAKSAGVSSGYLEDTLRGVARKNDITYNAVPQSVRMAIAA